MEISRTSLSLVKEKRHPIRLALYGFADQGERIQLTTLFARSREWQQPWEVVDNTEEAEFLLVAVEQICSADYPANISSQNIIAYANSPSAHANWYLRRQPDAQLPSLIEFTRLLKEIGQNYRSPARNAPLDPIVTHPFIPKSPEIVVPLKILIVGSVGSGKTTAVQTLTQGNCISTEAKPSDQVQLNKKSTTVAMDFGTLMLDGVTPLRIYGSPGQRRFDFMGRILLQNTVGIIILIHNELSDAFTELDYYLDTYAAFLKVHRAVVGVTHNERTPRPSLQEYNQFMQARGLLLPVFKVDARKQTDMEMLVRSLLDKLT